MLEFVDHLHEHFLYPCSINKNGRYNVPSDAKEGYRFVFLPSLAYESPLKGRVSVSRCTKRASGSTNTHRGPTGRVVAYRRSGGLRRVPGDLPENAEAMIACITTTRPPSGEHDILQPHVRSAH